MWKPIPVLPPVTMVIFPVRSGISRSGKNLDFGGSDWLYMVRKRLGMMVETAGVEGNAEGVVELR